jgi:hypothetical protein
MFSLKPLTVNPARGELTRFHADFTLTVLLHGISLLPIVILLVSSDSEAVTHSPQADHNQPG